MSGVVEGPEQNLYQARTKMYKMFACYDDSVLVDINRTVVVLVVFVPPVSFPILHPREIQILWSQRVREKNQTYGN